MIKNIINLTKIFFKSSFQNPYLIDKKTNKINTKSIFLWLIVIVSIAISFISYKVIDLLINTNSPTIFLNIFFMLLNIIIIFQVILASINVYFSSDDLELVLPLPIKTEELLISKFNTILLNIYFTEFIFAFFPLVIYGILTNTAIIYYFYLLIILFIFPIFTVLIISIMLMILMKLFKFIKNKNILQIIITVVFLIIIFLIEGSIINNLVNKIDENFNQEKITQDIFNFNNKLENINEYFLIMNPSIKILNNYNKLISIFELIKIIIINLLFLILFIFIGKKYYLKNILNNKKYFFNNEIDESNFYKKIKKLNVNKSYVKKEFKLLFKNPTFFIQCIFPTIILMISLIIVVIAFLPSVREILTSELLKQQVQFSVDISVICLILGALQFIFTMSNISISSISREGKNAMYMKFIPVDFYKQYIYKTIPQIFINMIFTFIILLLIKLIFPEFNLIYLLLLFILSNLLNILNSNLMVLVDLYRPNLNWKVDYEAIKNNNKLFQYVLTIIIILLLVYFSKIFYDINLIFACIFIIFILIIIILILNKLIKININKLFKKIN